MELSNSVLRSALIDIAGNVEEEEEEKRGSAAADDDETEVMRGTRCGALWTLSSSAFCCLRLLVLLERRNAAASAERARFESDVRGAFAPAVRGSP